MKVEPNPRFYWWEDVKVCCKPEYGDWFDISLASFMHFFTGYLAFGILLSMHDAALSKGYRTKFPVVKSPTKLPWLRAVSFVLMGLVLHGIIDFLENVEIDGKVYSFESLFVKLGGCDNPTFLAMSDQDSMQNFVGDNILFLLGSLVGWLQVKYGLRWSGTFLAMVCVLTMVVVIVACHLLK